MTDPRAGKQPSSGTSRLIPGEDDVQETEDDLVLRTALALMLDDARKQLDEPTQSRGAGLGVGDLNTRNLER